MSRVSLGDPRGILLDDIILLTSLFLFLSFSFFKRRPCQCCVSLLTNQHSASAERYLYANEKFGVIFTSFVILHVFGQTGSDCCP